MARPAIVLAGLLALSGCEESSEGDAAGTTSGTDASSGGSGGDPTQTGGDTEAGSCPDVVVDGSFEEGPLTIGWMTGSTNWETPICNATCFAGGNEAYDGDWWVWFGGVPVAESAFVSQMLPIAQGSAELVFHVLINSETQSANDTLTVLVDDQNVFMLTGENELEYGQYVEVRVDLTDFADGSIHLLSFDANFDGNSTTSFFLDSVELHSCS
jgi:hypothetical protein